MADYEYETERILQEIRESNARIVGLQFPEGLKDHAVKIAEDIEQKTSAVAVIFTDPVYGACDTKDADAQVLGADLLIHFGHTDFL
jgi:2-(3-amino-3-carboxypropyl)histidine synthase